LLLLSYNFIFHVLYHFESSPLSLRLIKVNLYALCIEFHWEVPVTFEKHLNYIEREKSLLSDLE